MGILNHYYEKSFAYVHNDLALGLAVLSANIVIHGTPEKNTL
jgi:hypothetical protein